MVLTVNIHTCGSIQPLSFMSPAWLPIRVVFTLSALHGYSGRDCVAARKRDIIHLKLTECYMSIMSIKLRKNPHSPDGLSWHDRPSLSCPRQCMSTFCDVQWPTPFSELSLSFSHLLYLQTCLVRSAVYPLCAMIPWGWSWTLKLYPRLLFTLSVTLWASAPSWLLWVAGLLTLCPAYKLWRQSSSPRVFKNRASRDQNNLLKV